MVTLSRSVGALLVGALGGLVLVAGAARPAAGQTGDSPFGTDYREQARKWALDRIENGTPAEQLSALTLFAYGAIGTLDSAQFDLIIQLAEETESADVRVNALRLLEGMGDLTEEQAERRHSAFVANAAPDSDPKVLALVLGNESLLSDGEKLAFARAVLAQTDSRPLRRCAAAEALGKLGDEQAALAELTTLVGDPRTGVLRRAVGGLLSMRERARPALPALLAQLGPGGSAERQDWILRALPEIGDPSGEAARVTRELGEVTTSPDVRLRAAATLVQLGDVRTGVEWLAEGLEYEVAAPAQLVFGEPQAEERSAYAWSAGNYLFDVEESLPEAPEPLLRCLQSRSDLARERAVRILASSGVIARDDERLFDMAFTDANPSVRDSACRGLAGTEHPDELYQELLRRRDAAAPGVRNAVEVALCMLADFHDDWVPASLHRLIVGFLRSDAPEVREAALDTLRMTLEPGRVDEETAAALRQAVADGLFEGFGSQVLLDLGLLQDGSTEFQRAGRSAALSNARQLMTAALSFAQDYDEHLPGGGWPYLLTPYVKNTLVMASPGRPDQAIGFVMNEAVVGLNLSDIPEPANTVVLFEAEGADKSVVGGRDRLAYWWADGRTVIGFADGHAKACTREQVEGLVWSPAPTRPPAP